MRSRSARGSTSAFLSLGFWSIFWLRVKKRIAYQDPPLHYSGGGGGSSSQRLFLDIGKLPLGFIPVEIRSLVLPMLRDPPHFLLEKPLGK